jgi:hypothetical protein
MNCQREKVHKTNENWIGHPILAIEKDFNLDN